MKAETTGLAATVQPVVFGGQRFFSLALRTIHHNRHTHILDHQNTLDRDNLQLRSLFQIRIFKELNGQILRSLFTQNVDFSYFKHLYPLSCFTSTDKLAAHRFITVYAQISMAMTPANSCNSLSTQAFLYSQFLPNIVEKYATHATTDTAIVRGSVQRNEFISCSNHNFLHEISSINIVCLRLRLNMSTK